MTCLIDESYDFKKFIKNKVENGPVQYAGSFLQKAGLAHLSYFLHEKYGDHCSVEGRMLLDIKDDDGKQMYHKVILVPTHRKLHTNVYRRRSS